MFDPLILRVMAITESPGITSLDDPASADTAAATALIDRAVAAARGGATCIQVRLKQTPTRLVAEITRRIIQQVNVPVLVNDRFDIALAAGAAGVHVGADDIPVAEVRRYTPPGFIIGTSVGCDAEVANAEHADFVGIGPVYATQSKADAGEAIGVREFVRLATLTGKPAVAIGNITAETTGEIITAGAAGVAAIRAIFTQDPESAARKFRQVVDEALAKQVRGQ